MEIHTESTFRLRSFSALALLGALALTSCSDAVENETGTPYVPDTERYPGNDNGGLPEDNLLEEDELRTVGTVNSYKGEQDEGDDLYEATVAMEPDNPNLSLEAQGTGNDPVTPNGPLADGTIGQPDAADIPTAESARNQAVRAGEGPDYRNTYESGDSPYGNNMESRTAPGMNDVDTSSLLGIKAYVRADGAENMPVYVPGGNPAAYVDEFYSDPRFRANERDDDFYDPTHFEPGADAENLRDYGLRDSPTEQPEGDFYEVSTFRPALSDVTAATYANTLTKLAPKPGSQNYRVYQPVQLKITPLIPWNAPATLADEPYVLATLGDDCASAEDGVACSSGAFDEAIAPIVNDQRVARTIAAGRVDGFTFEIDPRGRVDMSTIAVKRGASDCTTGRCASLRDVLAGAIASQTWTPATVDGQPTSARVEVPFRYDVKRLGSKVNTP